MDKAGVTSEPEVSWVEPHRMEVVLDRSLPGMMVTHAVADFDTWLAAYDAAAPMQKDMRRTGVAGLSSP